MGEELIMIFVCLLFAVVFLVAVLLLLRAAYFMTVKISRIEGPA